MKQRQWERLSIKEGKNSLKEAKIKASIKVSDLIWSTP